MIDVGPDDVTERHRTMPSWVVRIRRPLIGAYIVVAALIVLAIGTGRLPDWAHDARLYYQALVPFAPYTTTGYASGSGFYYTPVMALAMLPLVSLGWPAFSAIWTGLSFASLGALGRWLALPLVFVVPVYLELWSANVALLMGVAIVIGFRYPAAWAFVLLTKVTPGVGVLWFAVRREWRALVIVGGVTAALAIAAALIAPDLWQAWWASLNANVGFTGDGAKVINVIPLVIRLPIAAAVVCVGAIRNQRWMVPIASTIATPVLWWNTLALLVAVLPLLPRRPVSWPGHARTFRQVLRRTTAS